LNDLEHQNRGFYGFYICSQWAFIHALLSRVPFALAGLSCSVYYRHSEEAIGRLLHCYHSCSSCLHSTIDVLLFIEKSFTEWITCEDLLWCFNRVFTLWDWPGRYSTRFGRTRKQERRKLKSKGQTSGLGPGLRSSRRTAA